MILVSILTKVWGVVDVSLIQDDRAVGSVDTAIGFEEKRFQLRDDKVGLALQAYRYDTWPLCPCDPVSL